MARRSTVFKDCHTVSSSPCGLPELLPGLLEEALAVRFHIVTQREAQALERLAGSAAVLR